MGEYNKIYWIKPEMIRFILLKNLDLKMKYEDVKEFCKTISVNVTEDEVKNYLNNLLLEENRELLEEYNKYQKLRKIKGEGLIDLVNLSESDIDNFTRLFGLELEINNYRYDGYSITYYKKYIDILKKKINNLFKIIDRLISNFDKNRDNVFDVSNKYVLDIQEKYDISLDPIGKISYNDVFRIVNPLVYNIKKLMKLYEDANKLSTYHEKRINIDVLNREGILESELYPSSKLQITDYLISNEDGYIPLTDYQKNKFNQEELKSMMVWIKELDDDKLFDKPKSLKKEK